MEWIEAERPRDEIKPHLNRESAQSLVFKQFTHKFKWANAKWYGIGGSGDGDKRRMAHHPKTEENILKRLICYVVVLVRPEPKHTHIIIIIIDRDTGCTTH